MLVLAEAYKKATLRNDFTDFQAIEKKVQMPLDYVQTRGQVWTSLLKFQGQPPAISKEGLKVHLWVLEQWQLSKRLSMTLPGAGTTTPVFHNPWRRGASYSNVRPPGTSLGGKESGPTLFVEFLASFKFCNFRIARLSVVKSQSQQKY